ncbi:hypothetical protein CTH30272_01201 [Allocatenococcus thiocycli]|nr:hypothetical protein CTH30272_01201 [Catenococcus thiocycli]
MHTKFNVTSQLNEEQLNLFLMKEWEYVPEWPRAMFQKKKGSYYVDKVKALSEAPWVRLHSNDRRWVMVDFDNGNPFDWCKLPVQPNVVVFNKESSNHQCFWLLKDPVYCQESARNHAAYKYLRAIENAIDIKYEADPDFKRDISKNPFHPHWEAHWIHDRTHTLEGLEKGLELDLGRKARKGKNTSLEGKSGRNTGVFDQVRFRAYGEVSRYKDLDGVQFEDWHKIVLAWCERANQFEGKEALDKRELAGIAKSIASFCWHRLKPKKKRMTTEQIKEAQRNAQKMTKAKQKGRSEAAIKEAIRQLKDENKRVSKAAVARLAGLSRVAVTRDYSHLFED